MIKQLYKALLISGIVFFSCSKPSFQLDTYTLDNIINKYVSEDYYPFLHVLIDDKDGHTIYEHSYVNRTAHPELEVDENTLIRTGFDLRKDQSLLSTKNWSDASEDIIGFIQYDKRTGNGYKQNIIINIIYF